MPVWFVFLSSLGCIGRCVLDADYSWYSQRNKVSLKKLDV